MSLPRVLLAIAVLASAFLAWRHLRQRERHRDLYECQMLSERGSSLTGCLESRGWSGPDVTDALIADLKRQGYGQ